MKALLAGFGGIGANVYWPELNKLGYEVSILDAATPNANYRDVSQITTPFDIAVICTPNFTHSKIAEGLAATGTKRIFVEKPGLEDSFGWKDLCTTYSDTQFHMVKNNMYRDNYGDIFRLIQEKEVIGVDINWLNGNRIPNPGSWFTHKQFAFGGISRDLMPHLYCFALKLFGTEALKSAKFEQAAYQRWNLGSISSTDYGSVYPTGTYNVDDTAIAATTIGNVTLKLSASWKEGYDKQSITLFFRDGTTYEWNFGLCPAAAYGVMLQDTTNTYDMDVQIHEFLEAFDD
jgi:predicted dehydrogenase